MYIKVVNERIQTEVVPGDIVQAGILISNSEVGMGSVSVKPLIYRLVCTNGMVADVGVGKRHVGRINESVDGDADHVQYFYKVGDIQIDLYKTRDVEAEDAEKAKRDAAREEERMIMESFHNITELMFNLRREFVAELAPADCKKGFPAIARYMACAADDGFDLDLNLIGSISRRNFCLLMAGACCTGVLAACGSSSSSAASSSAASASAAASGEVRDELIFVNYRDIRDLNPHLYAGEMYAQSILYDTLVSITADGYEGCLAESWDISEDGCTYTFHIRPNVLFSDGEKCDANAILANFNAILENRERHTWLEMMNLLVGVSAPDENTFVIEMSEPYYPMLTELGCIRPFAMISPNCMINGSTKDGVNGHIGTGPYVLTDFVTDEYAVFERNENYWGETPAIRKITVKVIPDNQTRIMALESGEIDLIFGKNMIDADAISQYLDSDKFTVGLSDPTSTRHIVMNTTHEILGDPAVRKALQHATDRQTISDGIFYGLEQPADTLYATTVPYCNVGLKPYEYSTETAAQILDEAGWVLGSDKMRAKDGKQLALDLLYNSDSVTEKTIAEYLQSEYLKLGISMTIHGEEEQSYRDNMKAGNFDMVFNICWGMPYDPQSSLAAMRAPVYGDYAAQQGLEDKAEIDEAITKILTSTDENERQELYKSVLTNLHEDAMYLPLTYECNKALYTSALHGVHFGTDQYDVPFADMYFE